MNEKKPVPLYCPSCSSGMLIVKLECPSCGTEVAGEYDPCPVCALDRENRRLFELFMQARGNLKQVQQALGVSYPTTRLRVEGMFGRLRQPPPGQDDPKEILIKVRLGELSVDEAEKLLSDRRERSC